VSDELVLLDSLSVLDFEDFDDRSEPSPDPLEDGGILLLSIGIALKANPLPRVLPSGKQVGGSELLGPFLLTGFVNGAIFKRFPTKQFIPDFQAFKKMTLSIYDKRLKGLNANFEPL